MLSKCRAPWRKAIHAIFDNYATLKHPTVAPMADAASSLDVPLHANLGVLAQYRRRLLRQAHKATPSARRLQIHRRSQDRFVAETNDDPKPFIWTADPNASLPLSNVGSKG